MKEKTTTKYYFTTEDRLKFKAWCVLKGWTYIDICIALKISYSYWLLILDGKRALQDKHKEALKKLGYEM